MTTFTPRQVPRDPLNRRLGGHLNNYRKRRYIQDLRLFRKFLGLHIISFKWHVISFLYFLCELSYYFGKILSLRHRKSRSSIQSQNCKLSALYSILLALPEPQKICLILLIFIAPLIKYDPVYWFYKHGNLTVRRISLIGAIDFFLQNIWRPFILPFFTTTPQILYFFSSVSPVPCCSTESFVLWCSGVRSSRAAGSDCRQYGFRAVK